MLSHVKLLDEMDEQMWSLLQRNLTGITEAEADWRPHPAANNVRWMVVQLACFDLVDRPRTIAASRTGPVPRRSQSDGHSSTARCRSFLRDLVRHASLPCPSRGA